MKVPPLGVDERLIRLGSRFKIGTTSHFFCLARSIKMGSSATSQVADFDRGQTGERPLILKILNCLLIFSLVSGSLTADDWDPNDDTFDPNLKSVVIGDRSWIGDPSPFVHLGLPRTGYTHVNATQYEGFEPSIQISLMVPLKPGETTPPAGGMLMLNKAQTVEFIKRATDALNTETEAKPIKIKTALEQADWTLTVATEQEQRYLQLTNKSEDKVDTYRFSTNASKKLLGAIQHSLKTLEAKTKK